MLSAMGVTSREKAELDSCQLRDVSKILYTQWKGNMKMELGPREWE